jgi:TolB-like protein/tetratricopeptide (TPR) repeat protein
LIYRFEDCTLDVDRRELRRGGVLRRVEPQVFDLLVYLIRSRDRVVERGDLFKAVWHGRLVSDATLSTRLNAARHAIGDTGREQRLICTFRGKGLRFVAMVHEQQKAVAAAPPASGEGDHLGWMLQERPAIAVLPFANLSGNSKYEVLANGFTEDLITALAKANWLHVASRGSSFAQKGKGLETTRIARSLRVRYVLEGSLQVTADHARIAVHLVDGLTGYHLWSKRYDCGVGQLALAQDDILVQAEAAIVPQIFLAERLRTERGTPGSLNAWECMVRALSLMNSKDRQLVATARQLVQRAVGLEPHSAQATSLLSFIATLGVHQGWQKRRREIPRSLQIAHNALCLNSDEPWAHLALGYAKIWVRTEEAIPELQKALSLDPNLAIAHYLIALAWAWAGQGEIALRHADMAERLNPRDLLARGNAGAHNNVRATACFAMERYREGIEFARKTIIDSPAMPTAHRTLLINSALAGETGEARAALQTLLKLSPQVSWTWIEETSVWTRGDDYRKYIEAFSRAGLK